MIKFVQKQYSEYDAMRALYVELMKYSNKNKFNVITPSELPAVLKGNNVVIERFVISKPPFGRDRYRMYLKIGAKAKLPDEVRLAGQQVRNEPLFNLSMSFKGAKPRNFSEVQKNFDDSKNNNNNNQKKNNNKKNEGPAYNINTEIKTPYVTISREVRELLGEAIKYDKKDRSLVLEFKDIQSAIRALNILPFGISYRYQLLDA